MLDVLEEFLTLHGHTYVRLDGSTGVEKRQRLMDRCVTPDTPTYFFAWLFGGDVGVRHICLGLRVTGNACDSSTHVYCVVRIRWKNRNMMYCISTLLSCATPTKSSFSFLSLA